MRRYVIEVSGDNDDLHQKALESAVHAANRVNVNAPVISAVVEAPPPSGFIKIINCTRRVK